MQSTYEQGSGVIIQKQGNLYTLATNRHVVCVVNTEKCNAVLPNERYVITTPDGEQYQVAAQAVKILPNNLDLAIIQFILKTVSDIGKSPGFSRLEYNSDRNYAVAQVTNSDILKTGDAVYTAGFPYDKNGFAFRAGEILAVVNKRLKGDHGGYTIIYNASTQPSMSD